MNAIFAFLIFFFYDVTGIVLLAFYNYPSLSTIMPKKLAGLYRDDGLAILRNSSGPNTDRNKKKVVKLFKNTIKNYH